MNTLGLRVICGLLLPAAAVAGEALPFPGEDSLYFYRAELHQVVDGSTVSLDLDLGFYVWLHKTRIRLRGVEVSRKTTKEGRDAIAWLEERLGDATELGELRVKTFPAPEGSEVPWVGVVFAGEENLNEAMIREGLAGRKPR